MPTATDLRTRLIANVHAAETTIMRADNDAIQHAIGQLASSGLLDKHTITFIRRAHRLAITLAAALNAVLDAHRELHDRYGMIGCRECSTPISKPCRTLRRIADILTLHNLQRLPTIDAAEALRRTQPHNRDSGPAGQLVTSIEEITDAYVVRHLHLQLPPPPAIPNPHTGRVQLVDKATGKITTWPLMPLTTIDLQYRRYKQRLTMELDNTTNT